MTIRILCALALSLTACTGNVQVSAQGNATGAGGATSTSTSTSSSESTGGGGMGSGGAGAGGGATVCGGLKSLSCAADEWCDFPNDDCGGADGTGVCRKRPADCPAPSSNLICACDGKSYPDACHAEQAGADVQKNSSCGGAQLYPCGPTLLFCEIGKEYCDEADGVVAEFHCLPLPASCLPPNKADCSCLPVAPDCGSCTLVNGLIDEVHGCG